MKNLSLSDYCSKNHTICASTYILQFKFSYILQTLSCILHSTQKQGLFHTGVPLTRYVGEYFKLCEGPYSIYTEFFIRTNFLSPYLSPLKYSQAQNLKTFSKQIYNYLWTIISCCQVKMIDLNFKFLIL